VECPQCGIPACGAEFCNSAIPRQNAAIISVVHLVPVSQSRPLLNCRGHTPTWPRLLDILSCSAAGRFDLAPLRLPVKNWAAHDRGLLMIAPFMRHCCSRLGTCVDFRTVWIVTFAVTTSLRGADFCVAGCGNPQCGIPQCRISANLQFCKLIELPASAIASVVRAVHAAERLLLRITSDTLGGSSAWPLRRCWYAANARCFTTHGFPLACARKNGAIPVFQHLDAHLALLSHSRAL
jgi:hypothetical protein